jgi:hypothetical protein
MGGWGSGRKGGYDTTEGYRRLDVRKLQRERMLDSPNSFGWVWTCNDEPIGNINIKSASDFITLDYRFRQGSYGEWVPMSYVVKLERTPCHFGGVRVWFRCPSVSCGRRVAVLYGAKYFVCRRCYRLAYPCQRESISDRATRRAFALRSRVCEWGGLFDPLFRRKGLHRKTFERIKQKYYRQALIAFSDCPGEQPSLCDLVDFDMEEAIE